jgi:hypothetical protein
MKVLKIATPPLALGNFCTISSGNLIRASKSPVLRKVVTRHLLQATNMRKLHSILFFNLSSKKVIFEKHENNL